MKRGRVLATTAVSTSISDLPIEILSLVIQAYVVLCGHGEHCLLRHSFDASRVDKKWCTAVTAFVIPTLYASDDCLSRSLYYTNWLLHCRAPRVRSLLLDNRNKHFIRNDTLTRLTGLDCLVCRGITTPVSPKRTLTKLTTLRKLVLENACVELWTDVIDRFKHLCVIDLTGAICEDDPRITTTIVDEIPWAEFCSSLQKISSLRHLFLPRNACNVSSFIRSMTNLQTLGLQSNNSLQIDDLREMPHLVNLSLHGSLVLHDFSQLTRIQSISISYCSTRIQLPSTLYNLSLYHTTSIRENEIACLTNLRSLSLKAVPCITDDTLRHLGQLEEIDIRGSDCLITDTGLGYLTSLRKLCINAFSRVTDNGIAELPLLTTFYIGEPSKRTYPLTLTAHSYLVMRNCAYSSHLWDLS